MPFFSIVTVSFNAENTIAKTIESVLRQDFDDYEIIIKDACSTDDTVKNIPESHKIKTVCSKDKGIYFGMNDALEHINGKYVLFLNCGDFLKSDDVLSRIYKTAVNITEKQVIVYGDYFYDGSIVNQPRKISSLFLYRRPLCHQSMFFSKELLVKLNGYNTDYRIMADYDLTVHAFTDGARFVYCDCVVSDYLLGGFSECAKNKEQKRTEYKKITSTYFSKGKIAFYKFLMFLSLKKLRQKVFSSKCPVWIRKLYGKVANFVNR